MSAHTTVTSPLKGGIWSGGKVPLGVSFGKMMMWFFLLSDAFTFSSLLVTYGYLRYSAKPGWVSPEQVFQGIPWLIEGNHNPADGLVLPLVFVGIMTFILIASSVTMVLAVEAGHRMDKKDVSKYMLLTVIGGVMFLGCQALEWSHLISEGLTVSANPFHVPDGVEGAGQNASQMFGALFFGITGFHGFHVFTGVVINIMVYFAAAQGEFDRRGHYEMIEKVGLYWHFVDLVWVFVFTLFYLI
jgi:cytochrome c oxidase subunit 3